MTYQPPGGMPPHYQHQPQPKRKRHIGRWILISLSGVIVLIIALGVIGAAAGGGKTADTSKNTAIPAVSPAVSATPAADALSPGDATFVAAVRSNLSAKGYSNSSTDAQIAAVGDSICNLLKDGLTRTEVGGTLNSKAESGMAMTGKKLATLAGDDICPAAKPATVTYVVTGSSADVTWGPSGSDYDGTVPMHITRKLGDPEYYAISAQLNGGGTVKCEIKVNGKVISRATASGDYNIADCEISQGLLGGWQDDN